MKAISMMQPYAWLFANGYLEIDDRTWTTTYRGPLAIHASLGFSYEYYNFLLLNTNIPLPRPDQFDKGGFVGIANLIACIPPSLNKSPLRDLKRSHLGAPGYYGFMLDQARPLALQHFRGKQGLFEVPRGYLVDRPPSDLRN